MRGTWSRPISVVDQSNTDFLDRFCVAALSKLNTLSIFLIAASASASASKLSKVRISKLIKLNFGLFALSIVWFLFLCCSFCLFVCYTTLIKSIVGASHGTSEVKQNLWKLEREARQSFYQCRCRNQLKNKKHWQSMKKQEKANEKTVKINDKQWKTLERQRTPKRKNTPTWHQNDSKLVPHHPPLCLSARSGVVIRLCTWIGIQGFATILVGTPPRSQLLIAPVCLAWLLKDTFLISISNTHFLSRPKRLLGAIYLFSDSNLAAKMEQKSILFNISSGNLC